MGMDGLSGVGRSEIAGFDVEGTPGGGATPREGLTPLLSAPDLAGADIGTKIAAMSLRASRESKAANKATMRAQQQLEEAAQRRELESLYDKADNERLSGFASAGMKIGGAIAKFGEAGAISRTGSDRSAPATRWQAGGSASEAVDAALSGLTRAGGSKADAEAKEHANAASRAKRALDESRDAIREDDDHMKKTMDFLKEFSGAQTNAHRAALHRA